MLHVLFDVPNKFTCANRFTLYTFQKIRKNTQRFLAKFSLEKKTIRRYVKDHRLITLDINTITIPLTTSTLYLCLWSRWSPLGFPMCKEEIKHKIKAISHGLESFRLGL